MTKNSNRIAIIDGCRTPFLRSGTEYYDLMAWELGRWAVKGLVSKTGISSRDIDHVIIGSVATDIATTNVARSIALGAGLPDSIPAHTCTLACISANVAITTGADMIASGQVDTVIAGGVESMSDPDIKISKKYRRFLLDMTMFNRPSTLGGKLRLLRKMKLRDFIVPERPAVNEHATGLLMGQTAERLAKRLGITRQDQDMYAELSHIRAIQATESGYMKQEVIPVVVPGRDKAITADNGPRSDTNVKKISKLRGAFDRKYGTVTAANSSFLTDGASAVLLMSEEKAKALGFKPKAFIRSYAYIGEDLWDELLLGPAFAIPPALKKAGLQFSDIGVLEIHEAFAAQVLGVIKCIESDQFARDRLGLSGKIGKIDMKKLNAHGGSLSIGHPFGATGGRLVTTCCNRLIETGEKFGIVAACAGGAIGSAIVIENAK